MKHFELVRERLSALLAELKKEAAIDNRLRRGVVRAERMLSSLKIAEAKYELVKSRKVPAKVAAKAAKAKAAAKKASPKKPASNVVKMPSRAKAAA